MRPAALLLLGERRKGKPGPLLLKVRANLVASHRDGRGDAVHPCAVPSAKGTAAC